MKNKKIMGFVILGAAVIVVACGGGYLRKLNLYKQDVQAIQVQNVDLNTVADGEYFGDCDVDFVRARVRVVVKDHVIEELELLEHYNGRGASAETLPSKMLAEQRIDVDAVAGATSSSKVIQEAVYNALTGEHTIRSGNGQ